MKWSLRIGRIMGIDVYIHVTFLLLLGFVGVVHWLDGRTAGAALTGVLFFCGLFLCVLLHEYGHALAARRYGIGTRDITLLPIGGVARLERMPDKPSQELVVALAGPLVNVVIAAGLYMGLQMSGTWQPLGTLTTTTGNLVERLMTVNIFLVLFNLLPAFPMDGGRVLRALLAMRMDYARATGIAASIGQGMAFLFGAVGLFTNPMLLFIAFFVWIGAAQEAAAVQMKTALGGCLVRDAMQTEFRTLSPQDSLGEAARLLLAGSQQDFPVVEHGRLAGMLPHATLLRALGEQGEGARVGSAMEREFEAVEANELLDWAMAHVNPDRGFSRPVLHKGQLVGLLTAENVGEFFMVRSALEQQRKRRTPPREKGHGAPPVIVRPMAPRLAQNQ
jgi:Zn-dependent protease/predicted transcriptional regulator